MVHFPRSPGRFVLPALLSLTLAIAAVGCGGDDDDSGAATTSQAAVTASDTGAASDALSAEDARSLKDARAQIASYCKDKSVAPSAPVALIESLYEIDPAATGADGQSVAAVAKAEAHRLAGCGAAPEAKRLRALAK